MSERPAPSFDESYRWILNLGLTLAIVGVTGVVAIIVGNLRAAGVL